MTGPIDLWTFTGGGAGPGPGPALDPAVMKVHRRKYAPDLGRVVHYVLILLLGGSYAG